MRLTLRQQVLLERLCKRNIDRDGAETGAEMAEAVWGKRAFTSVEQGQRTAKQLVQKGLAEELGYSPTWARCFGPTEKGRELLRAIAERG